MCSREGGSPGWVPAFAGTHLKLKRALTPTFRYLQPSTPNIVPKVDRELLGGEVDGSVAPGCGRYGFSASTFIWVCRRPKLSEWKSAKNWVIAQFPNLLSRPLTGVPITLRHMRALTVASRGNFPKIARPFARNAANLRTSWAGRSRLQECPTRNNGKRSRRYGSQVIASYQTLAGERSNLILPACARWRSLSGAIHSIHFECRTNVRSPPVSANHSSTLTPRCLSAIAERLSHMDSPHPFTPRQISDRPRHPQNPGIAACG